MPLSWNEIRHRAIAFSKEWRGETREAAERQSFWNEFFNVFGIRRRTVATFEEPVKKLSGDWGFIDLFWPGRLLAEHKPKGGYACREPKRFVMRFLSCTIPSVAGFGEGLPGLPP
jgi:hypothetical protein